MKKKWVYLIIILVGLVGCLPLLDFRVPDGHDVYYHFYRYKSVENAVADGQLIPQMDPNALGGFGYSWNLFYGPLPAYIIYILKLAVSNWGIAINIFTILCVLLSGIFMYKFIREVSGKPKAGLIAALIYMLAPYHLLDIFVRQAQGEFLTFIFIPLLFLGIWRLIKNESQKSVNYGTIMLALSMAGILLSHNLSVMIFGIFGSIFLIIYWRKIFRWRVLLRMLAAAVAALGLSAFFLLPMLEASSATEYNIFSSDYAEYANTQSANSVWGHALEPQQLLFDPAVDNFGWQMAFGIGLAMIAGIVAYFIVRKRLGIEEHKFTRAMLILGLVAILMASVVFPWGIMPKVLLMVQFPWRFLLVSSFALATVGGIAGAYLTDRLPADKQKYGLIGAISLVLVSAFGYLQFATFSGRYTEINAWFGEQTKTLDFNYSLEESWRIEWMYADQYVPVALNHTSLQAGRPVQSIVDYLNARGNAVDVLAGTGKVENYQRSGSRIEFTTTDISEAGATLELPLVFYPGIHAHIDGTPLEVSVSNNGLAAITLNKSAENQPITVRFTASPATSIGVATTGATTLLLAAYTIYTSRSARKAKQHHTDHRL